MFGRHIATIVFFLLAGLLYFIAPSIGLGLFLFAVIFEVIGWFSLFRDRDQSEKNKF